MNATHQTWLSRTGLEIAQLWLTLDLGFWWYCRRRHRRCQIGWMSKPFQQCLQLGSPCLWGRRRLRCHECKGIAWFLYGPYSFGCIHGRGYDQYQEDVINFFFIVSTTFFFFINGYFCYCWFNCHITFFLYLFGKFVSTFMHIY